MPHAEHTVTVNRPAPDVFDYLADGTHNRDWRTGVIEIARTTTADGEGATYRQVLTGPGGRRIDFSGLSDASSGRTSSARSCSPAPAYTPPGELPS
jgi:polyketide cyclase/dehydrase/lipid transport protein